MLYLGTEAKYGIPSVNGRLQAARIEEVINRLLNGSHLGLCKPRISSWGPNIPLPLFVSGHSLAGS